jgi:hypothetical protein
VSKQSKRGQETALLFPAALEISDNSLVASGKIVLQYLIQAGREVVQAD